MKKLIRNGMIYYQKRLQPMDILLENGRIRELGDRLTCSDAECFDAAGYYILPGFLDIHTHGAVGIDVNKASSKDYETISRFFATQGTTSWLCSILTDTVEQTKWCIREAVAFMKCQKEGARLLGIHLEGPFLAAEYKGAMPESLLQKGNPALLEEYQETAEGNIRYLTVSPEVDGAEAVIGAARGLGIRTAIGHSGASYETAWECIRAGAVSATHIFNAMKLMHQHFPAISGAALESDIYCEAICDGRHLHPGTVRILLKTKGIERVIAVTDSIMAAGMPDGEYRLGVNEVVVEDGDARLRDGTRAGSTLTMRKALQNLISFTEEPLARLIPLFTENPAEMLGIFDRQGSLEPGKLGDIVILDKHLNVEAAFIGR